MVQRTTTTTATLLVTVAVSALAGCVTVQRPALPAPAAAVPSQVSVPRPDGRSGTQVVQAPAREALEMVGPSRKPERPAPAPRRRQAPAAAPAERPPSSAPRPRPSHPHPRPAHPDARRHTAPYAEIPDVEEEVRRDADVCALGRKYGGWQGDSPEATICDRAYGR
ncbi:hypothetical protein [Streptomyces phaeofaciens]|uniref:hypothetical protein n=1 Tax=Streptomyces phaeofaciens TaxID=68254 RepID=UPI001E2EBC07|nr:hypothetical protein [Streptomyces phaeofaciens]